MSEVLELGGKRFVAGLSWSLKGEEGGGKGRRRRSWSVDCEDQVGRSSGDDQLSGVDGVPSVAAAMTGYLGGAAEGGGEGGWLALLQADDGRFAAVRVRDGVLGPDGDVVLADAGAAAQSVEAARGEGANVYATQGAVTDGGVFVNVDVDRLAEVGASWGMRRSGGGTTRLKAAGLGGALLALCAGGLMVLAPDTVFGLFERQKERVISGLLEQEPQVVARIDSVALVEACASALEARPPYMPAWEVSGIECHAWFTEWDFVTLRPELEGRAVMVVRWSLPAHYVAPLHRRIAEEHLSAWYIASVVETSAWAVAPLGPVLGPAEGEPVLPYLAFRREVDRHLGMQGGGIEYGGDSDTVAVTVKLRQGLGRIAELVAAIPGFEVVSLAGGDGGWVLEARPVAAVALKAGLFRELAGPGLEEVRAPAELRGG